MMLMLVVMVMMMQHLVFEKFANHIDKCRISYLKIYNITFENKGTLAIRKYRISHLKNFISYMKKMNFIVA